MVDLDIIEINSEQIEDARALSSKLSTPDLRKKGMMDMLGIFCAKRFLSLQGIKIDASKSVHRVPVLYEEFKITDLYHLGYRIDVITLYKEKSVKIPKVHIDMDILPDFYFVVQIGAKIKEAKTIGFIDNKSVQSSPHDSRYYYPVIENIFDFDKFRSLTKMPALKHVVPSKHKECMELFLKFIDNELPSTYKRQMIRHLLDCPSCLQRFSDAVEFEKLSKNIENYPELIKKYEIRSTKPANYENKNDYLPLKSLNDEFEEVEDEEEMEIEYVTHSQSTNTHKFKKQTEKKDDYIRVNKNNPGEYENSVKKYIQEVVEETVRGTLTNDAMGDDLLSEKYPQQTSNHKGLNNKKEVIGEIFEESKGFDLPSKLNVLKLGRKRLIIATSIMVFVLFTLSIVAYKGSQDAVYQPEGETISAEEQGYDEEGFLDDTYDESQARLIPKGTKIEDFSLKKPMPNQNSYNPTIAKISWEAPESLVKSESYIKFLQATGKNIKLNLQNELLIVNDIPINKEIRTDIKLTSHGEVISVKILKSSGSEPIDLAVKRVVEDTLKYLKPPVVSHSKSFVITLTVSLN